MRRSRRRLVGASVTALPLTGCIKAPMTYMRTFGPAADPITSLGWGLTIISCAVVIIIGALVLAASWRLQPWHPGQEPRRLTIVREVGGLSWIYVGVGVSTIVLFGVIIWTLITLKAVARPQSDPAFTIEIHAHQWWWEARYIGDPPARTFTTANELHIPVGKPVRVVLIGDDVIHSFWVPALAGKTDVIPGQTNLAWIQADRPGVYRGQCTEYCGEQHAQMAMFVIADPPAKRSSPGGTGNWPPRRRPRLTRSRMANPCSWRAAAPVTRSVARRPAEYSAPISAIS